VKKVLLLICVMLIPVVRSYGSSPVGATHHPDEGNELVATNGGTATSWVDEWNWSPEIDSSNPIRVAESLYNRVDIGGGFTWVSDGEYGASFSTLYAVWRPRLGALQLSVGPAYTFVATKFDPFSTRSFAQIGVAVEILSEERVERWAQQTLWLARLPIDLSDTKVFLGVGPRVDPPGNILKHVSVSVALQISFGGK
jgi:hypothetical protein